MLVCFQMFIDHSLSNLQRYQILLAGPFDCHSDCIWHLMHHHHNTRRESWWQHASRSHKSACSSVLVTSKALSGLHVTGNCIFDSTFRFPLKSRQHRCTRKRPIYAPSRSSAFSTSLPSKQYQSWSGWLQVVPDLKGWNNGHLLSSLPFPSRAFRFPSSERRPLPFSSPLSFSIHKRLTKVHGIPGG